MVEYDLGVEPSIEDMAKVLGSLKSGAPTRAESFVSHTGRIQQDVPSR